MGTLQQHRRSGRLGYETLDTVLGLSITPAVLGWILVDGPDAGGPTLARGEVTVGGDGETIDAATVSEQATAVALQLQALVEAQGRRVRGVGVTWSGDTAAEAALLLEALLEEGFDNVALVRFQRAAESLAQGVGKIAGSERTAVCVVGPGLATVVMMGVGADDPPTALQRAADGDGGLADWLAGLFAPGSWRPGVLVLAGSGTDLDALAVRLEAVLAVPVFVRAGAGSGLARGAARAVGLRTEFTGQPHAVSAPAGAGRSRSWTLPYAGALTMLVAGVLTLVVSLSVAVSLQLTPVGDGRAGKGVTHPPAAPSIAHAVAPAVLAPPVNVRESAPAENPREEPPPAEIPEVPIPFGSGNFPMSPGRHP